MVSLFNKFLVNNAGLRQPMAPSGPVKQCIVDAREQPIDFGCPEHDRQLLGTFAERNHLQVPGPGQGDLVEIP